MRGPRLAAMVFTAGVFLPFAARAVDFNFAGTLQLDYLFTPLSLDRPPLGRRPFDGFTQELSLKVAADLSEHVTANVKVCYGCHGFEVGMAYVDYRLGGGVTFRAGRFSPSFGEFGLRHDPGNHRLPDKPLPYDMGRMLHLLEFDRSVLPAPYVDNGVEVLGHHSLGRAVTLDWAAHAVTGLRARSEAPYDIEFTQSRQLPYIDNNARPSVGGRVGLQFRIAPRTDLTVGASTLYGPYDNNANLQYLVAGTDLWLRIGRSNIRAEYLYRRTDMAAGDQARFEQPLGPMGAALPASVAQHRDGWYIEWEQPVLRNLDLIVRWDGLRRSGNVRPNSPLDSEAGISRLTLGTHLTVSRGFRVKAAVEHYTIWGLREQNSQEIAAHLGVVATF
ncbi:MAG: hypothetical protein JNK72_14155 [Myxococcales bacterium]|nr:hypothetical protein [Myxococcales bacterium]